MMIEAAFAGAALQSAGAFLDGIAKYGASTAKGQYYARQAILEGVKADYDVARQRERTARVIGRQQNTYLGQGFTLDGSPTDVAWDSLTESEKDVYAIRFASQVRQENYRAEADNNFAVGIASGVSGMVNAVTPWLGKGTQLGMQSFFPSGGGRGPSVFMGGNSNPYAAGASWGAV